MTVSALKALTVLVSALAVFAAGTGAYAQSAAQKSGGYALKIGYLFPSSGGTILSPVGTTSSVKPKLLTFGISEDVGSTNAISSLTYGYYGDYFDQASKSTNESIPTDGGTTTATATGKGSGYALGIQVKTRSASSSTYSPYSGVGVGYYHMSASLDGFDKSGNAATFSASKSSIGGKLFVGVQTKSGLLGELDYQYIPETDADYADGYTAYKSKLAGFGVSIGYKL